MSADLNRFVELEALRKVGRLSDDQKAELRRLVHFLNLIHPSGEKYCYCEENNFACNPDDPWPGCTCVCVELPK